MNYTNKDKDDFGNPSPRGEILVRGPNLIPGYYKNDLKNEETFVDGWLLSGDIGQILPGTNALKIIDRKKNIFKLAQGEYIAPEKLESFYKSASPLINDIYVYGDSLQHYLVAIVWVEEDNLKKMGEQWKINDSNLAENQELKKALKNEFLRVGKE